MFTTLVVVVHVITCIALILIILLQTGKGADIGAVFGGGSSHTVFGSTGAASFLSKVTIAAAVTFMVTSIVLSYFSGRGVSVATSVMEGKAAQTAPLKPGPAGGKASTQGAATNSTKTPAAAPSKAPSGSAPAPQEKK